MMIAKTGCQKTGQTQRRTVACVLAEWLAKLLEKNKAALTTAKRQLSCYTLDYLD
jgi:hypothetical protein